MRRAAIAVLFTCFLSGMALANVSGPFTTSTPIPATLTDWSSPLSFPKFDSSLGTLTAVQLDLQGAMSTELTVTNNSPEASSGYAKTHLQLSVQDAENNLVTPQIDLVSDAYNYDLAAGQSLTSGSLTKSGSSSDTYTSPAILAEFNGPGTIVLNASTFTETFLANTGGNTEAGQVTTGELTGTVTYIYTPEPASLSMLAVGALGLFSRRRSA